MKEKFKGLWPAMLTPVKENGEPALEELEKLVELFIAQDLDGLYILGSTGQGLLFSENQRKLVTERVSKTAKGRIPIIVHVGAMTTAESMALARHAEKFNVDGISSVGPVYYPANAEMVVKHYSQIAGSTGLPFFPYQFGDSSIPAETIGFVQRLLEIPTVHGMKLTTNQLLQISAIFNCAGDRLKLFSGSDELFCHASLCGTVGAIGTFYNLWGPACKQIMQRFTNGDYESTRSFMLCFQKVIQQVLPNVWPFLRKAMQVSYDINIGPTKWPLGNTQEEWSEEAVESIIEEIESIARKQTEPSVI